MAIVAGAALRMGGPEAAASVPGHGDYYAIAAIILFIFAAIVAPELLRSDRREGTINLYLVRPLSGGDYIIARWSAFVVVMIATAWLPQVILFLGAAGGANDPLVYLRTHWLDVPRFLLDLSGGETEREVRQALMEPRLERFIGVIYRPETERWSHYSEAILPRQFDAWLWFDETRAVTPLESGRVIAGAAAADETYPFGL